MFIIKLIAILDIIHKSDSDNKFALIANAYSKIDCDTRYYAKTDSDNKFALTVHVYNTVDSDIRCYAKAK